MYHGLGGLRASFPAIRIVVADDGHRSRQIARTLKQHEGWRLLTGYRNLSGQFTKSTQYYPFD